MSISSFGRNALLDSVFNTGTLYVQLHTGDPGDGMQNLAEETRRQLLAGAPASEGVFRSVNDLLWEDVPTAEILSHISIWDDPVEGRCYWTGALAKPQQVNEGNTFRIPSGSLTTHLD